MNILFEFKVDVPLQMYLTWKYMAANENEKTIHLKHQMEQFYYCSSSHSHCEIFNDVYIFYMKVMWPLVTAW